MYKDKKKESVRLKVVIPKMKTGYVVSVQRWQRIQMLVIDLAKRVGVDFLASNIKLHKKLSHVPMDPASTVHQNDLKDGEEIFAHIISTNDGWVYYSKSHDFETVSEYHKYMPKKQILPGLNLEAMCVHPRCIEYGKVKVLPQGTGHFNINQLLSNTKCSLCPDRDKGINPPMAVKEIKLVSCYWRYEGDIVKKDGFPSREFLKGWRKVENFDNEAFGQLYQQHNWKDLVLVLRGL